MKNKTVRLLLICLPVIIGTHLPFCTMAQNVGIGSTTPASKLHIKGSADNTQLIIDANSTQSNSNPLIKLRKSDGTDLMWIHSDETFDNFIGVNSGRVNDPSGGGYNTFIGANVGYSNTTGGTNTAIGSFSFYSNTTGALNTAIGKSSLYNNISSSRNTAVGAYALTNNTTANFNTAIGSEALYFQSYNNGGTPWDANNVAVGYKSLFNNQPTSTTNGYQNTGIGTQALYSNTTGSYNTANGAFSLFSNTTGNGNSANGFNSLAANTTGSYNTAEGMNALGSNTEGTYNIAIGFNTLLGNTKGSINLACGNGALRYNSTANNNIAIGDGALYSQSYSNSNIAWDANNIAIGIGALYSNQPTSTLNGIYNTALGNQALNTNTTGSGNFASGFSALYSNTTGSSNIACGVNTLNDNTTGSSNIAIGSGALYKNVTGSNATAIGFHAMFYANNSSTPFANNNVAVGYESLIGGSSNAADNTGNLNTAIGYQTLKSNTSGNSNTACGYNAVFANDAGSGNTGCGYNTLLANTTGNNNSALGKSAYFSSSGLDNTTCIGYFSGGYSGNISNHIEIGNSSVTFIGGQVAWSTYSDERIKDNITTDVPGLSFINRLRPVTYNLNIHRENDLVNAGKKENSEWPTKYDIEKTRVTGFLAQDVEQAAREIGYDFSGVQAPKNTNGLYSLRYSDFVMPLVKAVQEQQEMIEKQNTTINEQTNIIQDLVKRITALENKGKKDDN